MSLFITYLVKASLMYLLCFLLYWGLFRKETFFIRNRVFLLISLILPALIPLIHFPSGSTVANLMPEGGIGGMLIVSGSSPVALPVSSVSSPAEMAASPTPFPWETIALLMYLSGVLFFLLRILLGYSGIIRLIIRSERKRLEDMILVITQRKVSPFSLFRWLVIPGSKLQHADLDKIIRHEMVHFRQMHSIDLLLSELLVAFQWFNPFAWMLRSSIVKNNEFYVDRKCMSWYSDPRSYQYALLNSSLGGQRITIANSFNQIIIKKRIEMMNRKNTRLINRIKDLLIVPFSLLLIVAFSAYSGKPAEAVADTQEPSVVSEQQDAGFQDKVTRKDTSRILIIRTDGKELSVKDLASVKVDSGDFVILRMKNLDNSWSVVSREKLEEFLKEKKFDKESGLVMISGGEDGDDTKDILKVLKEIDTADLDSGHAIIEKKDGKIVVRTKDGKTIMDYVINKGNHAITIGYSKNVQGKNVLLVIDGKEYKEDEWSLTDLDHIEIITVLDSVAAVKLYGDKGKHGVIEITTKK